MECNCGGRLVYDMDAGEWVCSKCERTGDFYE